MIRCIVKNGMLTVCLFLAVVFLTGAPEPCAATENEASLIQQGNLDLAQGNYTKAAEAFRQAIRLNASAAEAYAGLGDAYFRLGANETMTNENLLEKALEAFHAALRLNPDLAATRRDLGLTALALGNREEALAQVRHLQKLNPRLAAELSAAVEARRPLPDYREIGMDSNTAAKGATRVNIVRNAVLVPVTLCHGGQSVQAMLVLDTGASVTTVSPEIAARLGIRLDNAPSGKFQVVGGSTVKARAVRLDRIIVGPHTRNGMTIAVIGNKGPLMEIDGLLGMDFLRDLRYHIDFSNKLINWAP
ncbi:MAG TPA: aspartyl protease family protein [Geobacteraceae bacterium]|nr:aspartyl protease family protein [Geobacteraceae bacterium]